MLTRGGSWLPEAASWRAARPRALIILLAAALLTFLVYFPAVCGGFVWDDYDYLVHHPHLASLSGLWHIWFRPGATPQYYPVTFSTFWAEYQLWGFAPVGYHVVNIACHLLAALLFGKFLRRLGLPGAWLAAVVFLWHPVHVESVAWISERKNVLSAVWALASAHAFWSGCEALGRVPRWRATAWYAASVLCFQAALWSKSVTASLPVALALLLWWRGIRDPRWPAGLQRRAWLALLPFLVLAAMAAMTTIAVEQHHVGATGEAWSFSAAERVLIAGRAVWFYAMKLVWPAPLIFIYPRWTINAADAAQWAYPAGVAAVLAVLWLGRRRWGRGPVTAATGYVVTLLPALGFVDFYPMRFSFVADHFQYHASFWVIAAACAGLASWRPFGDRSGFRVVPWMTVPLLTAYGALVWQQSTTYADHETLWRVTLERNPSAWVAHNNYASIREAYGDLAAAEEHYRRAVELHPRYVEGRTNLAQILIRRGRLAEAKEQLAAALAVDPTFGRARKHWYIVQQWQAAGRTGPRGP